MKIITFTCDIYADAIPAYHYLWNKAWPDCPHEMIYVTNSKPLTVDATVHYLKGKDIEYGRRLRKFVSLHCDDNELGLFMMGDYFVKGLNISLVEQARGLCERDQIAHCRLRPMPSPQGSAHRSLKVDDKLFGLVDKKRAYALSLQPGIWRPKDLGKCVRDAWGPWACEVQGSKNTKRVTGALLSTRESAITHLNYYKKGKPIGVNWVMDNVPGEFWPRAAKGGE